MELLSQWGISGFMDHVSKVEEFYKGRRDKMQQAAEKHLSGNPFVFNMFCLTSMSLTRLKGMGIIISIVETFSLKVSANGRFLRAVCFCG